jgi:PTH1 family peptidyl-tRNA hydrolase
VKLLVGLGNPGARYAQQRHNIGFMAVDAIAREARAQPWRSRFQGEATEATLAGERVLLLKPQTFMNESGRAVGEAMRFFKLPLADVIVFHDELDLPPAKVRVKLGGGNAGHNGLRSISALCGNDYVRVRLGIGHPGDKALVHGHVLSDFARAEQGWVDDLCRALAAEAGALVGGDQAGFQQKVSQFMTARGWGDVKLPGERPPA